MDAVPNLSTSIGFANVNVVWSEFKKFVDFNLYVLRYTFRLGNIRCYCEYSALSLRAWCLVIASEAKQSPTNNF